MNIVPVANHGEHQNQKCDQQEPSRLRCIHGMPVMFLGGTVLSLREGHADIVALNAIPSKANFPC